jgi:hypothetical protein
MSNLPIDDLKALIRDTIYDTLYRQYYLMPKVVEPSIRTQCSIYIDGQTERKMVAPCHSLQYVMKTPDNFVLGDMTHFNFLKFDESKIKYCPYCGLKFK